MREELKPCRHASTQWEWRGGLEDVAVCIGCGRGIHPDGSSYALDTRAPDPAPVGDKLRETFVWAIGKWRATMAPENLADALLQSPPMQQLTAARAEIERLERYVRHTHTLIAQQHAALGYVHALLEEYRSTVSSDWTKGADDLKRVEDFIEDVSKVIAAHDKMMGGMG